MALVPAATAQEAAMGQLLAFAGAVLLLADLVLLGVLIAGRARGRPLLTRRWSAAHVLIALNGWLALTLVLGLLGNIGLGVVLGVLHGAGKGAPPPSDTFSMRATIVVLIIAQNIAMAGVVLYAVQKVYDQEPVAAGLSLRAWGPKATLGLLAALVLIPVSEALQQLSALALRHLPLPEAARFLNLVQQAIQEMCAQLLGTFSGPGGLAAAILLIGIVVPFGEELFFRGFAYRCFRSRWGPTLGMVASAALFSLVHVHPLGLLPIFAVGCALAYLYERTGTLVAPFTFHAVNNIVAVVLAHFSAGR